MTTDFLIPSTTIPNSLATNKSIIIDSSIINPRAVEEFLENNAPQQVHHMYRVIKLSERVTDSYHTVADWLTAMRNIAVITIREGTYKPNTIAATWQTLRLYLNYLIDRGTPLTSEIQRALDRVPPPAKSTSPRKKLNVPMRDIIEGFGIPVDNETPEVVRWVTVAMYLFEKGVEIEEIRTMSFEEIVANHVWDNNPDLKEGEYITYVYKCRAELSISDIPEARKRLSTLTRAVVGALACNGLRATEIGKVKVEDYDPDSGELQTPFLKGKSRAITTVTQTRKVLEFALAVGKLTDSTYLTPKLEVGGCSFSSNLTGLSRQTIHNHVASLNAELTGITNNPKLHPHYIRAAFATELLRVHNLDLVQVADILGHSSVNTTQGYIRRYMGTDDPMNHIVLGG
jgi:site-specific recombinase XerC